LSAGLCSERSRHHEIDMVLGYLLDLHPPHPRAGRWRYLRASSGAPRKRNTKYAHPVEVRMLAVRGEYGVELFLRARGPDAEIAGPVHEIAARPRDPVNGREFRRRCCGLYRKIRIFRREDASPNESGSPFLKRLTISANAVPPSPRTMISMPSPFKA